MERKERIKCVENKRLSILSLLAGHICLGLPDAACLRIIASAIWTALPSPYSFDEKTSAGNGRFNSYFVRYVS